MVLPDSHGLAVAQAPRIGCGLVLNPLDLETHVRTAHADAAKAFKTGKIHCAHCENNWGNLQNNCPAPSSFAGRDTAFLKFENVRFVLGSEQPLQLSAKSFRQVIPTRPHSVSAVAVSAEIVQQAAIVATEAPGARARTKHCQFFHSATGCRNGSSCSFLHGGRSEVAGRTGEPTLPELQQPPAPAPAPAPASAPAVAKDPPLDRFATMLSFGKFMQPAPQPAPSAPPAPPHHPMRPAPSQPPLQQPLSLVNNRPHFGTPAPAPYRPTMLAPKVVAHPVVGASITAPKLSLADALQRLHTTVVASAAGRISSTSGMGKFYSQAGSDGPALKEAFKAVGGIKKATAQSDNLRYEQDKSDPLLGWIVPLVDGANNGGTVPVPAPAPEPVSGPSVNRGAPSFASSTHAASLATSPPPLLNSLGLPLRPGAKPCAFWLKERQCKYGASCKHDHPGFVEEAPSEGVVDRMSKDKQGNLIGFLRLQKEGASSWEKSSAFFFHGPPACAGFMASGSGAIHSAGLELVRGDRISGLVLKQGREAGDWQVVTGSLVECARRTQSTFAAYMNGLCSALTNDATRRNAQHSLCHAHSCTAVWGALAAFKDLVPEVVQVIELMVQEGVGSCNGPRAAASAVQTVLLSAVTLPPSSLLHGLIGREGNRLLRARLVQALCTAWTICPQARRRSFILLQGLVKHHPAEAAELLGLQRLMELLSASLPGGDHISCYSWRDLPLKLLQSETTNQPGIGAEPTILTRVLRNGGDYENFDAYMEYAPCIVPSYSRASTDLLCQPLQDIRWFASRGLLCGDAQRASGASLWETR